MQKIPTKPIADPVLKKDNMYLPVHVKQVEKEVTYISEPKIEIDVVKLDQNPTKVIDYYID